MARIQVYLPDELHAQLKKHGWPASKLMQDAVRAAIRRESMERYISELAAEVGEPPAAEVTRARALAKRIARSRRRRAA